MIKNIVIQPNPILRQKGKELERAEVLHPDTQQLIADLIQTMYTKDGVGLAAPQIGVGVKICVIAKQFTTEQKHDLVLINPTWKKATLFKEWDEEGCLSVPNTFGKVKRYKKIKVHALNANAEVVKFTALDFGARVIQHEVDHLNGVLFIDKAKEVHVVLPKDDNAQ